MATRFAIRSDRTGYAVYDSWTGLPALIDATVQDGLALQDAAFTAETLNRALAEPESVHELWDALLAEWRETYDAIATFALFEEGVLLADSLGTLERLREVERRARDRIDGFLESLR